MTKSGITQAVCAVLVLAAASVSAGELSVWTTSETRRVLRDEPAGELKAVKLSAAKNETESFQILLRCDEPIAGTNLIPADLQGPGGAILPAPAATLYRQHQLHITRGTYRNKEFREGWYADPLIPFKDPMTSKPLTGARFTAVPFDLPANQTHGFWVDIYVAPETPAGLYKGSYSLETSAGSTIEIPISLQVWAFALPRVSTMQTALGSPAARMRGYYRKLAEDGREKEPTDWDAIEAQCAEMLTAHRINATPPRSSLVLRTQGDGSLGISDEEIDRLREFIDTCHVNAIAVPSPAYSVKDPDKERDKLNTILKAWDYAAARLDRPHVTFYVYLKDEPNDKEAYEFVQKWGAGIRQAESVVKVMVVEQTWTEPGYGGADSAWGSLNGAVDIWCPLFCLFKEDSAARRQAQGETIWTYTALCQGAEPSPWWHIDYPLLHYRVPAWIAWRYNIRGLLYWGGMSYWQQSDDPWTDPWTYGKPDRVYNGEGTLVYPAGAVGYEGIVPSLRLKALRDSIEDYEYMSILRDKGLNARAREIVEPLAGSWFDWNHNPAEYEKARIKLAELIVTNSN